MGQLYAGMARVRVEKRAKWTSWSGNGGATARICRDSFRWGEEKVATAAGGRKGRRARGCLGAENYDGRSFLLNSTRAKCVRCLVARDEMRRERARVKTPACRGFVTRFDPLTLHVCKCNRYGV